MPLRLRFGSPLTIALLVASVLAASCSETNTSSKDTIGDVDENDTAGDGEDAEEVVTIPTFTVALTADKTKGNVPLPVQFELKVEADVPLTDFFYSWDFGDGDLRDVNPDDNPELIGGMSHTFKYKGTFPTRVTVTWRKNLKVTKTATVEVEVVQPAALSLSTISVVGPTDLGPNDTLKLAFDVMNSGAAITSPFQMRVVLSQDDVVDAGDLVAHTETFQGMESGLEGTKSFTYTEAKPLEVKVPAEISDGSWFIFVDLDPAGDVSEINKLDNQAYATSLLQVDTAIVEPADLTITPPVLNNTDPFSPGATATYTVEIKNIGKGEAKTFKFAVYLSKDEKLDVEPTAGTGKGDITKHDILITDSANSTLKSFDEGKSFTVFRGLSVPQIPDGAYFLIAKVDIDDVVAESNEDNNIAVSKTTLTVKATIKDGFDLALLSMKVSPKGTYLGGNIGVTWHVKNLGTKQTPKFPATVFFCPTSSLSKAQCVINQTKFEIEPMAVGQELTSVTSININTKTPVQDWYLFMLLDPDNTIAELDEGNNIQKWDKPPLKVTATAQVEIKPENVGFHPASVVAGNEIKVSHKMVNTGTTGSGATETWYVLSATKEISLVNVANGKNIVVKKVFDPGVEGLDIAQRSQAIVVPDGLLHSLTEVYVGVIIDATAKETTDSKGNNTAVAATPLKISGAKGGCYDDDWDGSKGDNDTADKAATIATGTTDKLGSCGDEDWWSVTLKKGDTLIVQLLSTEILWTSPVASDLDLEIVGPDGKLLDSEKGLGNAKQAVALTVAQAGTYKIRVAPHAVGTLAQYALKVQIDAPPAGIDLFGSGLTASPAAAYPGGLIQAKLSLTNLGATPATAFTIRLVLSADTKIDVTDVALKVVSVDGLGAAETTEIIESMVLPVIAGGKYYLGALIDVKNTQAETNETNNAIASNVINLNQQITCATDAFSGNHTIGAAAPLPSKSASYEKLNICPGLEDWFKIDLPKGQAFSVKINWTPKQLAGLVGLQIVDASGTGVVAGTANPFDPTAKIPYLQVGGTYYLHTYVLPIAGKPAEPYDYSLDLTIAAPDPGDVCLADAYESNNSAESALELGCGVATMTLCIGDEDWFYLDLVKDEQVKIGFTHVGAGIEFSVYDNPKAAPLNKLSATGTVDFKAPADGKYFMRASHKVAGAKPTGTFTYELKVDGGKGIDLLPKIQSLFPGDVVQGEDAYLTTKVSNECKDDAGAFHYAWYFSTDDKFDASDVKVYEQGVTDGLKAKTVKELDDKVPLPVDAVPGPAWLFIKVDNKDEIPESQEINNVDGKALAVVKLCLADALEPNNTPTYAKPLDIGTVKDLSLCPYELDWYVIEAQAGETITLTATFDQALGDLDLRLYEPGKFGTAIAAAATKKAPEQIVYKASKSGKLYLRIGGFAGDSNSYSLSFCASMDGACLECPSDLYCSGGAFCAKGGVCKVLGCTLGDDSTCDDGNSCTIDACVDKEGCTHTPAAGVTDCEDGDACTLGESCDANGVCVATKTAVTATSFGAPGSRGGGQIVVGPKSTVKVGSLAVDGGRIGVASRYDGVTLAWSATITAAPATAVHLAGVATQTSAAQVGAVGWVGLADGATPTLPTLPEGTTALFVALDGSTGAIVNQRVFSAFSATSALHDVVANAGGWVAVGTAKAAKAEDGQDAWIVGLDKAGQTLWQAQTGGAGSDRFLRVRPTAKGWLAAGSDQDGAAVRALVGHVVTAGTVDWTKVYASNKSTALFHDAWMLADGTIVAAGGTDEGAQASGLAGLQPMVVAFTGAAAGQAPTNGTPHLFPVDKGQGRGWISAIFGVKGGWIAAGAATAADAKAGLEAMIWTFDADWKVVGGTAYAGKIAGADVFTTIGVWYDVTWAFGSANATGADSSMMSLTITPPAPSCDDSDPCTTDTCDAKSGCTHAPMANGTVCGFGLVCDAGVCK